MDRMRALSWYLVLFNLAILIILTFAVYYRGGDSIPALQILLPVMILAGTGTNAWLLGEMRQTARMARHEAFRQLDECSKGCDRSHGQSGGGTRLGVNGG